MKAFFGAALALAFLSGCATPVNWKARVGIYTHDQAILELGPPEREARLADGTMVDDWLTQRGQVIIESEPYFGPPGYYFGPPMYTTATFPNYYLRLVFAPDGKLESWKKFAR